MGRLVPYRRQLTTRLHDRRTKPGTLLKHHISLKTDRWGVSVPGFAEIVSLAASSRPWGSRALGPERPRALRERGSDGGARRRS